MTAAAAKKLALALSEIADDRVRLASDAGRRLLGDALACGQAPVIARAAALIAAHALDGFEASLRGAYRALSGERAHADPGCLAKEALVTALDALESLDAELFAAAAVYEQLERVKGGPRDTGARVRARGVLGLARLGHPDLIPILGACLADRDGTVRLSAARAVAHRGDRQGAGLLLLKLGAADDDGLVTAECVRGLFAIAPDLAQRHARAALRDPRPLRREQTLHALGTAAHDGAVELLAAELAEHTLVDERLAIIEALGLSLQSAARALLLDLVRDGGPRDAEAALAVLAIHRYDDRLVEQVRDASAHSPDLARRFRELYVTARR